MDSGGLPSSLVGLAADPLRRRINQFLTQKTVAGCTAATLKVYRWWLTKLDAQVQDTSRLDSVAITKFLSRLRDQKLKPASVHQAWRTIRTFCRWLVATQSIRRDPLKGVDPIRTPRELPVPCTEDELRLILKQCPLHLIGRRNYAIILVLADAGIRQTELRRLLVENWSPSERSLFIRAGKGQKDRVVFVSPITARALKQYLQMRGSYTNDDFLFASWRGRPVQARSLISILHRLSKAAGLKRARWVHPHALRHLAVTSWINSGMDYEAVRKLAGWSSLDMVLKYSHLTSRDAKSAHRRASALERMRIE